jgi:hypothetical protein
MVSCSSDEPAGSVNNDSTEAISLDTYVARNVTRADVQTDTLLKANGFGVFAYYDEGKAYASADLTGAPNFMSKQAVTYDKDNTKWTYTPVKYWSKNTSAYYHFLAYAPLKEANENLTVTSAPVLAYNAASSNYDFMTAVNKNQQNPGDNTVPFKFAHRLTRIGFIATTADTYDGATIKITSAKLTGVNTAGSYALFDEMKEGGASWTNTSASEYAVVSSASSALKKADTNLLGSNQYLFLVPTSGASYKLDLEYTIEQAGPNNTTIKYTETASLTPAKGSTQDFVAGKAYNFNIKISLNQILFTVSEVAGWGDTTDLGGSL